MGFRFYYTYNKKYYNKNNKINLDKQILLIIRIILPIT